jgi:hypothetical protein
MKHSKLLLSVCKELPTVSTEELQLVTGGECPVFNYYRKPATITPDGGSPIHVPPAPLSIDAAHRVFPAKASVPDGDYGLKIGNKTILDGSGKPRSFHCHAGSPIDLVPDPSIGGRS